MQPAYYTAILERLKTLYGLSSETEHEFIHEMYEGPLPIFKLLMTAPSDSEPSILLVSFHLELDSPSAIQWYLRLRSLDPNVSITACYLKDADNTSYVGEDAEILRMYMIEQDVIAAYIASDVDAADVLNRELPTVKPSPLKTYATYRAAIVDFHKRQKSKEDISH